MSLCRQGASDRFCQVPTERMDRFAGAQLRRRDAAVRKEGTMYRAPTIGIRSQNWTAVISSASVLAGGLRG